MSEQTDFVKAFDALCQAHGMGTDNALEALADAVWADAAKQDHETVKALLESAAEALDHAAFEIYASYK